VAGRLVWVFFYLSELLKKRSLENNNYSLKNIYAHILNGNPKAEHIKSDSEQTYKCRVCIFKCLWELKA
jgi:hypothetical protein